MKRLLAGLFFTSLSVSILLVARTAFSATVVTGHKIVIDPGHGGSDFGSTECPGYPEKEANLDIADALTEILRTEGVIVYLTRTDDSTLSNADRYNYANNTDGEVLVSIHLNGSVNHDVNGTQGLYGKGNKDKAFTEFVHQRLAQELGVPDLGVTNFASGVLLKSNMPATIQETVFISNTDECAALTDETYRRQEEIAQSLYHGLVDWFSQQDGDGGDGNGRKCETPPCGKNK